MSLTFLRWLFIVPVAGGTIFGLLCVWTIVRFRRKQAGREASASQVWPPVSILKPVHGLEKNLHENLRTACLLDYPDYEVIFSVQRRDDPAIPVLREIEREFGTSRAKVVVEEKNVGWNGKINNLAGALPHARHDVYVISDSDVRLPVGYLKSIVAPLRDQSVGFVCTPFRVAEADRWFEKLELLSLNADFMPSVIFAYETSASLFCLGASIALRRKTLDEIGGIEGLSDYLVEDYEMGRRIVERGYRSVLVLPVIETMVDLKTRTQWWKHQVYWDQNTRAARPLAYFCTLLIRAIPCALVFALLNPVDSFGWAVLAGAIAMRMASAGLIMRVGLEDREGLRALWLLPLRDVAGMVSWLLSFLWRKTTWRGTEFVLTADGRLAAGTTLGRG
jgi:ceramide glucosyltransferase